MTSSEKVVERSCPKNFHFHGAKSHKHQKGRIAHDHHVHSSPVNDAKPVVIVPGNDDDNSCLEGTLAGGVLGVHWVAYSPKKTTGFGRFLLVLSVVRLLVVRSMAVDCLSKISLLLNK